MGKFDLNDYEPVESRIKRFYTDHKDGSIKTELLSSPDSIETVVVKASIFVGDKHVSDGMAFEKAGDGYVNKTSHVENCETSAIGRALANFNYSGDKRASREEMAKVNQGEQKKPPAAPPQAPKQSTMGKYGKDRCMQFFKDFNKQVKDDNVTKYFNSLSDEMKVVSCEKYKWDIAEIDKAIATKLLGEVAG